MSIFTKEKVYWMGPRESDIAAVKDLFAGSFTIFGSNRDGNVSFCNALENQGRVDHNQGSEADLYILHRAIELYRQDPTAKFMLYNGNVFNAYAEFLEIKDAILCRNESDVMKNMNDKNYFHELLGESKEEDLSILKIIPRNIANCNYDSISEKLKDQESWFSGCRYIVQAPVASGGNGTFILDSENGDEIRRAAGPDPTKSYLVSVFQENNVSVNVHAIIYANEVLILPGSIQIMKEDQYRLMYRGADYIAYRKYLSEELRSEVARQARLACKEFQKLGYRGVCGIDAIISDGKVKLLEVNNRFQASTNLLNLALRKNGMKTVPELNVDAFTLPVPATKDRDAENIEVDFSDYVYIYNDTNCHARNILENAGKCRFVYSIDLDGFNKSYRGIYPPMAHLFRVNFTTNIVWVNEDKTLNINENIADPVVGMKDSARWIPKVCAVKKGGDLLPFKIALMTQGVRISAEADKHLSENGSFRPATNNAIDLAIEGTELVVNAPLILDVGENGVPPVKFTEFTPFVLSVDGDPDDPHLVLLYYGNILCEVSVFAADELQFHVTKSGIPYSRVGYFSTDRLRLHLTNHCRFKRANVGCRFCNMGPEPSVTPIAARDMIEVVLAYFKGKRPSHYMIGGQSPDPGEATELICNAIGAIRRVDRNIHHPINAMIVPCEERELDKMITAGLNEITCNLEIYDETCREKYMPGKGKISRDNYFDLLENAVVRLCDHANPDRVRSMLVVGLEPMDSMLQAIKELVSRGIQPMLSVFRPLPETELADVVPPAMETLYKIFQQAEDICAAKDLHLGPPCHFCQNNTLSLPY